MPEIRVDESPPFTHIGVDFAGPLFVKSRNQHNDEELKYYICLFTCASTRAVHLELVESLDVDSFIRAFRRFSARRGLPSTILSDNAKTFKTTAKEVKCLLRSPKLHESLSYQGVKWKLIVERSPWQGGFWERLVRSVKRCLVKVVGRALLNFFELSTILVEIEAVINARPLTYVFDDSEGVSYPLTPSHLINGRNLLQEPNDRYTEIVSIYESLSRRAKYQHHLLSQFTKRWKEEYLIGLMEAYKTKQNTNDICISTGDLVILKDDQTKRQFWKVCKVEELIKGADAKVRAAKVQVPSSKGKKILQRPLQHLIPIEVRCDNESQHSIKNNADNGSSCIEATAQAQSRLHDRPRRSAAAVADLVRRDVLNIR